VRLWQLCISVLALVVLSGCASPPRSPFTPYHGKSDEAVIYVYRPWRLAQAGGFPMISLDGREIGILRNGSYLAFTVPPGTYKVQPLSSAWTWPARNDPVRIDARAGQQYFVQMVAGASGFAAGGYVMTEHSVSFREVAGSVAWQELPKLEPSNQAAETADQPFDK
jgi:hypothetical protein